MDIFSVLTMIGGLAMFLYGMKALGDGLAKMAGGRLEQILETLTSKKIYAVLLGAGVTAVIQSSSATTVMVVGFVNSGIMKLSQAVGVIMGANIGTTATSWILSLAGVEGDSILINMLKPTSFSPILAAIGVILLMTSKATDKKADIGTILVGFAILMFGMETMKDAVEPLADNQAFTSILTMFSMPVLGVLAGAVLTAVIQSSSASVGILQALCLTGAVSYATAFPIIMGQNIGTCITSILSAIGANKNAKRAAAIHLSFNMIGTVIFLVVFYSINSFMHFAIMSEPASATGIAVIHTAFNVICTIILYPFSNQLVRLATFIIRDDKESEAMIPHVNASASEAIAHIKELDVLDVRFLDKPGFAMEICRNVTAKMAEEAKEAIVLALDILKGYDANKAARVIELEQRVDCYEDALGSYLIQLSARNLSGKDSQTMSLLLHSISDFERISDHAINIQESAEEIYNKKLTFSDKATAELDTMIAALKEIINNTVQVFETEDIHEALHIEPLEETIDYLEKEIKQRHIKRLRKGECTIELGLVLEDVLTNIERVSDHCSNIAVALIEIHENEFETHAYIDHLNKGEGTNFYKEQKKYEEIYKLP